MGEKHQRKREQRRVCRGEQEGVSGGRVRARGEQEVVGGEEQGQVRAGGDRRPNQRGQ